MRITKDLLDQYKAPAHFYEAGEMELIDWANTPERALFIETYFVVTENERKKLESVLEIEDSVDVWESSKVRDSESIFGSYRVTDSKEVYDSQDINDSSQIISASNIESSTIILQSENVQFSDRVVYSRDVDTSNNIIYSHNVSWSEKIVASIDVHDCAYVAYSQNMKNSKFCYLCRDCKSALFCAGFTEGGSYLIFNRAVSMNEYLWMLELVQDACRDDDLVEVAPIGDVFDITFEEPRSLFKDEPRLRAAIEKEFGKGYIDEAIWYLIFRS